MSSRKQYDLGQKQYPTHTADGRPIDPRYDREPRLRLLSAAFAIVGILAGLAADWPRYRLMAASLGDPDLAAERREEVFGHPTVAAIRGLESAGRDIKAWWDGWLSDRDEEKGTVSRKVEVEPDRPAPARAGTWRLAGPLVTLILYILLFHLFARPRAAFAADFYKMWSTSITTRVGLGLVDFWFAGSFASVSIYWFL